MMFKLLVGACCLLAVGVSGQRFRQPNPDTAPAPQLDLASLGPTTTPVPILVDSRRIDLQTGAFVYEYAGGDGSSKFEFRYPNGTVVGNYTFVDELGVLQTRVYSAGVHDPSNIDETTDPNYVDLGNYEHYRHLERPYVHQDESFTSFATPQQQLLSLQQPRQPVRQQQQQPARPIPPPVQRQFVQPQHIPRPQIQPAPQRQHIQVPQLPSVSVPLDFNTHSAARAHFSQPPIIAPTFAPPAHRAPAPAPAPIPRHHPVPAPNFAPAPRPAPRAPTFAPVPVHRPAPRPAPAFAPAPSPNHFQAPGHFPSNLGQSVVRQQPQPLPQAPHRLSAPQTQQNQHNQHAAAPSPGQSTSDFLDSVINKFQG